MQDVISLDAPAPRGRLRRRISMRARAAAPTRTQALLAAVSAILLVFSFPDFELWPLAWVGLVPLALAAVRPGVGAVRAFVAGWAAGAVFFYATCYWLTHAFIHYGGIPRPVAFVLLIPAPVIAGLFPGAWAYTVARVSATRGVGWALAVAPFAWAALEWARLGAIGQLWNALAYSQAFVPALIQPAHWGGVYLVGFLIASVNSAVAHLILRRDLRALSAVFGVAALVAAVVLLASYTNGVQPTTTPTAAVVAVQPNVSADFPRTAGETALLINRHLTLSAQALRELDDSPGAAQGAVDDGRRGLPRVVVWPESPMPFRYARDENFREFVAEFARANRASVIFNAVEPAPMGGVYNSAVMVNEEGRLVAQYDKIRLLPFGEYVPLPRWLPPAWLLEGIVGDFATGNDYPLMPVGDARAGVFICFESAFPSVAGRFARDGADVLVNITNDGYLGQTPVIRQHLANVVFRAVETGRPVLRVTNTGVSAHVTPRGEVQDATETFRPDVRTWTVGRAASGQTFYTRQGDLFVALCAAVAAIGMISTFTSGRGRLFNRGRV